MMMKLRKKNKTKSVFKIKNNKTPIRKSKLLTTLLNISDRSDIRVFASAVEKCFLRQVEEKKSCLSCHLKRIFRLIFGV